MSVIIKDIETLVEAIRLAASHWQGDLGAGGSCRIEREIREVILAHATIEEEAK